MIELRKKIEKLVDVSDEYQKLFNECLIEWIEIETGKKYEEFQDYANNHIDITYHKKVYENGEVIDYTFNNPIKGDPIFVEAMDEVLRCHGHDVPMPEMNGFLEFISVHDLSMNIHNSFELYLESKKIIKFNYYDKEFRKLRHEVFLRDGEICAKCEVVPGPGLSLTIDHIKPVSKYPELAMDVNNFQVLCWPCNQGKSNLHNTDYRKKNGSN